MPSQAPNNIAIIGGGLSGTLLAVNLLKKASAGDHLSITLIDRNPETDLGAAYSTVEECLLLNVPACRMGAVSADPAHFLSWARSKGRAAGEYDFLPRKLYKEYIQELLQNAQKENQRATLKRICGEATDIKVENGRAEALVNQATVLSDKVVLALGNFPPRNLPMRNDSSLKSECYFQNPWADKISSSFNPNDTVFLIGTGQTTVDMIVRLNTRGHAGKIIALSRHGLLPLPHTTFQTYPSFQDEIMKHKSMADIFRTVRRHFAEAEKKGMDRNAVIDSMRSYAQELWVNLLSQEQSRFLRHVVRYYEIIRSRIPPENMATVNQMRESGQLTIIRGRIHDMESNRDHIEIHYLPFGETEEKTEAATLVVNCIGPEMDVTRIETPLIKNLLGNGLIQPHVSCLGINANPNGAIIHRNGETSNVVYTLGPTMRGVLWETIAAPEIRAQAEQLAGLFLKTNG